MLPRPPPKRQRHKGTERAHPPARSSARSSARSPSCDEHRAPRVPPATGVHSYDDANNAANWSGRHPSRSGWDPGRIIRAAPEPDQRASESDQLTPGLNWGASADQLTVTSPCRQRRTPSTTGQSADRSRTDLIHRCRAPSEAYGAAAAHAAVEVAQEGVHRLARHIAVDQRLRQPFGQVGGAVRGAEPGRRRSPCAGRRGRARPRRARRPISSQVPSTSSPPGASRAHSRAQTAATSRLVVLAQHVRRPDQHRAARPAAPRSRRAGR